MSGSLPGCPSTAPAPERRWLLRLARLARTVCAYLLAAVFLAAGVTKVTDLAGFRHQLELHTALPLWLASLVAYALPWLELVTGWCLALGQGRREAALIASMLLGLFILYDLWPVDRGVDCGCLLLPAQWQFANRGPWPVVRNLALLAGAGWLVGTPS